MTDEHGNEEQEGFGQATLGEGQASNPRLDPEMLNDEARAEDEEADADPPSETEDPDAGAASTEDELDPGGERDQAEG